MQKCLIADTGISVSKIGLGTVKFGRNTGVKYPHNFNLPTDSELQNLLSVATDLGINLLDTAPAYGSSEERIGKLLQGNREKWIISTKVGETFHNDQSIYDFSPAAVHASINQSLTKLRTDYLDIVLVHSNGNDTHIIEHENIFATLHALKQSGKIRAYGMSTKTLTGGLMTIDRSDVAMVTYNTEQQEDKPIIEYALKKQKSIFIKKALASGHLPSHSLQLVLNQPGITSIILGTINIDHLRENCSNAMEKADAND